MTGKPPCSNQSTGFFTPRNPERVSAASERNQAWLREGGVSEQPMKGILGVILGCEQPNAELAVLSCMDTLDYWNDYVYIYIYIDIYIYIQYTVISNIINIIVIIFFLYTVYSQWVCQKRWRQQQQRRRQRQQQQQQHQQQQQQQQTLALAFKGILRILEWTMTWWLNLPHSSG